MKEGLLVGADITQEWLLPWWWSRYSKHNTHPVAFVDFGMSFEKKRWCQERGALIPLRLFADFIRPQEEIAPEIIADWENLFGKRFWPSRSAWFKKPFALLQTPFAKTLWIDLDCEIRGPIAPLFSYRSLAMLKEPPFPAYPLPYPTYNSGVISYPKNCPWIEEWAQSCIELNDRLAGDQEVFSYLIAQRGWKPLELPATYNWSRLTEDAGRATIYHWHGAYGKYAIRHQISLEELSL